MTFLPHAPVYPVEFEDYATGAKPSSLGFVLDQESLTCPLFSARQEVPSFAALYVEKK